MLLTGSEELLTLFGLKKDDFTNLPILSPNFVSDFLIVYLDDIVKFHKQDLKMRKRESAFLLPSFPLQLQMFLPKWTEQIGNST